MIYVTGDMHADPQRFKAKEIKKLKKGDTLIVCGDFGFVWNGCGKEQKMLKWIGRRPYQVLFVEGTHDNMDLLAEYPVENFCGGSARHISGRCWQLMRGEIYRIEDQDLFTFGGGCSTDVDTREQGVTWWPSELPELSEIEHARAVLEKHGHVVDYIITHSPSDRVNGFLDMDRIETDQLGAFLDEVVQTVRYKKWFFGKFHVDKVIPPLYYMLYQNIIPIQGKK